MRKLLNMSTYLFTLPINRYHSLTFKKYLIYLVAESYSIYHTLAIDATKWRLNVYYFLSYVHPLGIGKFGNLDKALNVY